MEENKENKPSVTVADFDALIKEMGEAYARQDAQKAIMTAINKEVMALEARCVAYLKELDRKNFSTPFGTPYVIENWKVNNPATDLDKKAFFNWLEEQGGEQMRMKYTTVNNVSLNSLYKTKRKEALERGELLVIPGLGAANLHEGLGWRKAKGGKTDAEEPTNE